MNGEIHPSAVEVALRWKDEHGQWLGLWAIGARARRGGRKLLAAVATAVIVSSGAVVIPAVPASATGVDAVSKTAAWAQSGNGVALIDGQLVTYSLNATRDSTPDTTGVTISDTLPVGLDYVSSDGPGAVGCRHLQRRPRASSRGLARRSRALIRPGRSSRE